MELPRPFWLLCVTTDTSVKLLLSDLRVSPLLGPGARSEEKQETEQPVERGRITISRPSHTVCVCVTHGVEAQTGRTEVLGAPGAKG